MAAALSAVTSARSVSAKFSSGAPPEAGNGIPMTTALPSRRLAAGGLRSKAASRQQSRAGAGQPKKCPLCAEAGIVKLIRRKTDLKRHLRNFHNESFQWICPVTICSMMFD